MRLVITPTTGAPGLHKCKSGVFLGRRMAALTWCDAGCGRRWGSAGPCSVLVQVQYGSDAGPVGAAAAGAPEAGRGGRWWHGERRLQVRRLSSAGWCHDRDPHPPPPAPSVARRRPRAHGGHRRGPAGHALDRRRVGGRSSGARVTLPKPPMPRWSSRSRTVASIVSSASARWVTTPPRTSCASWAWSGKARRHTRSTAVRCASMPSISQSSRREPVQGQGLGPLCLRSGASVR